MTATPVENALRSAARAGWRLSKTHVACSPTMPTTEPVLSLLKILIYEPLPREEVARRFGRTHAEFESALSQAGPLVRLYGAGHGNSTLYITITPDGRQSLQAG